MKKLLTLLLSLVIVSMASAQNDLESRIKRIENGLMRPLQIKGEKPETFNINDRLKAQGIPGLSIAFVSNGKVEWARAYGMADIDENKANTTETLFLAGSISKPIAALRAHQLVEEGKLSLDENINNYLTSWQLPDNEFTTKEKVTLRRILNHTAGLTVWGFPGYDKGDKIPTVQEVLDGKGNTDSVRVYKEPGESWMYSGGGYTIMQLMVEEASGTSFPATMRTNILDRMNMQQSTFENPLPQQYHAMAATGYRGNGQEVEGKWPIYTEMAAAGLWTTPSQLIQYGIEIQKINNTKKDGVLKYASVKEMLTPGMNNHGLGPQISENSFGHGGADEGFRANMVVWKDKPHAVVVMVNSDNGSIMQEILIAVANEYNLPDVEVDVRNVVKMSSEALSKYAGKFQVGDMGVVQVAVSGGDHITFEAPFIGRTIHLAAESETAFFDRADGTPITFDIETGKVTGFKVQGLQATRVK